MFSDVDNGRENHVTLYRGTHVHKSFSHEDLRSNSASYGSIGISRGLKSICLSQDYCTQFHVCDPACPHSDTVSLSSLQNTEEAT